MPNQNKMHPQLSPAEDMLFEEAREIVNGQCEKLGTTRHLRVAFKYIRQMAEQIRFLLEQLDLWDEKKKKEKL